VYRIQERRIMNFRISALNIEEFRPLFGMTDEALGRLGVQRVVAEDKPGYPCRVSLEDAEPGETLLLLNYEHQPVRSPYRSRHAIYVREAASQARPGLNTVPESLRCRLLSVRAFDADGLLVDADVVDGRELETLVERMLGEERTSYLHVHNARAGCYAARVDRG
jgi:Protein of unknown function (DUF1203)